MIAVAPAIITLLSKDCTGGKGPYAQDAREVPPLQRLPAKACGVTARCDIEREYHRRDGVEQHQCQAAACNAHSRDRTKAEDQHRRDGHEKGNAYDRDEGRHYHITGASDHARQPIHEPGEYGACEHDIGIGDRRIQFLAAAAQGGIDLPTPDKEQRREGRADA